MTNICDNCGFENDRDDTSCAECDHLLLSDPDSILEDLEPINDEVEQQIHQKLSARMRVLGELGRGGMAIVYKAIDPELNRKLAVKCMPVLLNQNRTAISRFKREAQVMANLNHPNIVPVYSVGELEGIHYFTMAFLPGGDLLSRMSRPMDPEETVGIIREAASALDYAHGKGLVHRDIKPTNIMFDEHGVTRILDFGIAKVLDRTQLTMTRSFMGTPFYMSPEQGKGLAVDGRCDLYSLGVVFYQMITGILPFESEEPMSIIYKHIHERPKPPIKRRPSTHPRISKIILKLMEKDPKRRFQTGAELIEALDQVFPPPVMQPTLWRPPQRNKAKTLARARAEQEKNRPTTAFRRILKKLDPRAGALTAIALAILAIAAMLLRDHSPPPLPEPPPQEESPQIVFMPGKDAAFPELCWILPTPEKPKPKKKPRRKKKPPKRDLEAEKRAREAAAEKVLVQKITDSLKQVSFVNLGGVFKMGTRLKKKDSRPIHNVRLAPFAMATTEVTQTLWEVVMETNPSCHKGPLLPVENVSYAEVEVFLERLNRLTGGIYALPSEAQWEFAAKSGLNKSNNLKQHGWYTNNAKETQQVATKQPNKSGIYDLRGNVGEWCADWYDAGYYRQGPEQDPTGPETGTLRVVRGGSWQDKSADTRVFSRASQDPGTRACTTGFRLVKRTAETK